MARAPKVHTVDFETGAIGARPTYPPQPVGVSIRKAGQKRSRYYAFAHPTGNNATREEARRALLEVWDDSHTPLLFHNGKFDYDVGTTHLGMPALPWDRVHDTLFLLFLNDPHQRNLSLKPAAEKLLGLPPTERDAVREWLIEQRIVKKNDAQWGAHISKAPGDLVGKYAGGDTDRTLGLHNLLWPTVCRDRGMLAAYDRERRLMPVMLENERAGMRVDLPRLERDVVMYRAAMEHVERWLRKRLKSPSLNFNAREDVADALDAAGIVTEWATTKTGKRSTSKKNLTLDMYTDARVAKAMGYRNRLQTALSTFLEPWLEQARETGGTVHTSWNQVRGEDGGARTGRFSSSPNFMNIPNEFGELDYADHVKDFVAPGSVSKGPLPPLPFCRVYILPDEGHVFCSRDYSQQEPRILAHFTDDSFAEAYRENPRLDAHTWVATAAGEAVGQTFARKVGKVLNLAITYGLGDGELAKSLGVTVIEARAIKLGVREMMPGLGKLEKELKSRARMNLPFRTWGEREYYCEPPAYSEKFKRVMTFDYKMVNVLIQGSAADCTKESILNYHELQKVRGSDARFLVTVHDENNITAPAKHVKREMNLLREAMESVPFDVPMLSDGETGPNWHELTKYTEN